MLAFHPLTCKFDVDFIGGNPTERGFPPNLTPVFSLEHWRLEIHRASLPYSLQYAQVKFKAVGEFWEERKRDVTSLYLMFKIKQNV